MDLHFRTFLPGVHMCMFRHKTRAVCFSSWSCVLLLRPCPNTSFVNGTERLASLSPTAESLHFASSYVLCCLSLLISSCQQTLCEQVHLLGLTKALCYSFPSFFLRPHSKWSVPCALSPPQCNIYKEVFLRPCDAQWRGTAKKRWIIITWKRAKCIEHMLGSGGLFVASLFLYFLRWPALAGTCWWYKWKAVSFLGCASVRKADKRPSRVTLSKPRWYTAVESKGFTKACRWEAGEIEFHK